MGSASEPQSAEPSSTPAVPLDEVMLAMDVVDTLRHQRAIVAAAFNEDERERGLIERIRAIYSSQGIEVPDEVITEGVAALEQDRFTYHPPERTTAVRLAEIYVDRGKWTKRTLLFGAVLIGLWLAITVPLSMRSRAQIEAFSVRLDALTQQILQLDQQRGALHAGLSAARAAGPLPSAVSILGDVERGLDAASSRLDAVRGALAEAPDPEDYPAAPERLDRAVRGHAESLTEIASSLGTVDGQLRAVKSLGGMRAQVQRVMARLTGLAIEAPVAAELARLRAGVDDSVAAGDVEAARRDLAQLEQRVDELVGAHELKLSVQTQLQRALSRLAGVEVETAAQAELQASRTGVAGALAAGDADAAQRALRRLQALVEILDQSYELRIVSRGDERSGVWRDQRGRGNARNYYVIVEPVASDGSVLTLSVTSEEDNNTRRVSRFGLRVPESVYESVKADKLDNGIVDDNVVGTKRRGARAAAYRIAVAGGMITEW